jgi:hypothetical protein
MEQFRKEATVNSKEPKSKTKAVKEVVQTQTPTEAAQLYQRAEAVLAEIKTAEIKTLESPVPTVNPKEELKKPQLSSLYANETLEMSPQSSPTKTKELILSPFSKAKKIARSSGVNLDERCKGVYTEDELYEKIAFLAQANKKFKATPL